MTKRPVPNNAAPTTLLSQLKKTVPPIPIAIPVRNARTRILMIDFIVVSLYKNQEYCKIVLQKKVQNSIFMQNYARGVYIYAFY